MTDSSSTTPPAYTSGCGSVTITGGPDAAPTVRLTMEAVRLPARDLAELVTFTAREAADAARAAEAEQREGFGSAADALAQLKDLRDGLREEGLEAVIERKRAEFDADEDRHPDDPRTMARLALGGPDFSTEGLDMAIQLLERFQPKPGDQAPAAAPENVVGTATAADEAVTVEATGEYPVARVLLGIHARELGPEALGEAITEAAAAAAEDLRERRRAQIDAMGLPLSLDQVEGLPAEMDAYGRKILGQAEYLRRHHDEHIKRLRQ